MLRGVIDDSGSGGDSPWFVLAGFASTIDKWAQFDTPWIAALHAEPRIEFFKASEAGSLRGEFRGFTTEERDAKVEALIGVIEEWVEWPISARVRQADYNGVFQGSNPKALG